MSCKTAIYTANTSTTAVADGDTLSLGTIIRRFGRYLNLNGDGITISSGCGCDNGDAGYYQVDVSVVAAPTAAGTVTATLYKDGVAIPGALASATVATAGDIVTLAFTALVRQGCNCTGSSLTVVLSGAAASVTNVAVVVEKI